MNDWLKTYASSERYAPRDVTMYIYSNKLPGAQLTLIRCIFCTRPLFRTNTEKLVLSNAYGAGYKEHPPGSSYIEHQCHACKSVYHILFQ